MGGRFAMEMMTPRITSARHRPRYGSFTEEASCNRYACSVCADISRNSSTLLGAALRMKRPPSNGPRNVPNELNAWVRFKRLDAVFAGPRTATYGFAAT